jgi:hypothetical protein
VQVNTIDRSRAPEYEDIEFRCCGGAGVGAAIWRCW